MVPPAAESGNTVVDATGLVVDGEEELELLGVARTAAAGGLAVPSPLASLARETRAGHGSRESLSPNWVIVSNAS